MVTMAIGDDSLVPQNDQQLTFQYGDPFPAGWTRFAEELTIFFVRYQVPRSGNDAGVTAGTNETAFLQAIDVLPSFPTAPLRPQVSPVTGALIDGASYFADQTLSSPTPTIRWNPPAVGSPTYYTVRIRRMSAGLTGGVLKADVARIFTAGTQVVVPPGILQPGSYYDVRVTAVVQPGHSIATLPYESQWPTHTAPAFSGLLTLP